MSFKIIQNDITKMNTEAIVNATDIYLANGIGGSSAIHEKAGKELEKELNQKTIDGEITSYKINI